MKPIRLLLAASLVCACHRNQPAQGPFERAGQGLDTATDKTGHALSGAATTTGHAVQKAGHATGKAFEKVGDKLGGKSPDPGGAQPSGAPQKSPN